MLEVSNLTKSYGGKVVVDNVNLAVNRGRVTGFVGPNGAGKTTTMRMITGLIHPDAGYALFEGKRYAELEKPLTVVGSSIGGPAANPRERVRSHLRGLALAGGISSRRVDVVLEQVGLQSAAKKRIGAMSMGMGQRLALAEALLGEPEYVILDEPFTGLDVEGIRWLRTLIVSLAASGAAVLLSNHHMAELELLADDLIMIGSGKIVSQGSADALLTGAKPGRLVAHTERSSDLLSVLQGAGFAASGSTRQVSVVIDGRLAQLRQLLTTFGIPERDIEEVPPTLEDIFVDYMQEHTEYVTAGAMA